MFGDAANEAHAHDPYRAYAHVGEHVPAATDSPMLARSQDRGALDALLEINGEWHDKERIAGLMDPNSGGSSIFISPGLRFSLKNWTSYVSLGIPIANHYNGIQATPAWRTLFGISVVFGP
ncbi:hypothetical protein IP86_17410 [Rhodopseudomonas sp. AAP120]|nr:hypothetical protein Rpal_1098 [Rhodopseudomonas palustris TIE-1]KPF96191.1 hypothetical protein IP86_17410 [Rhodopseudomonas sp. AAP120]